MAIDPDFAKDLLEQVGECIKDQMQQNRNCVVLTSQQVRPHLNKLIEKFIPNVPVLAHGEIAGHVAVTSVGMIGG